LSHSVSLSLAGPVTIAGGEEEEEAPEFYEGMHNRYGSTLSGVLDESLTDLMQTPGKLTFNFDNMKYNLDDDDHSLDHSLDVDGLVLVESSPGRGDTLNSSKGHTLRNAINIVPAPTAEEAEDLRWQFQKGDPGLPPGPREKSLSISSQESHHSQGSRSFSRKYSVSGKESGGSGEHGYLVQDKADKENMPNRTSVAELSRMWNK